MAGAGTVYSATTIRVAGIAHAAEVPFVLLLVDGDDGVRCLGRCCQAIPPPIGARVRTERVDEGVLVFTAI